MSPPSYSVANSPLSYSPPPPRNVTGPGTTAFLFSANGDMGMEGSPSFEGDTQQRAQPSAQGTAAGIRRDLAKAEAKAARGDC